jgi:hypothetical protein
MSLYKYTLERIDNCIAPRCCTLWGVRGHESPDSSMWKIADANEEAPMVFTERSGPERAAWKRCGRRKCNCSKIRERPRLVLEFRNVGDVRGLV